MKLLPLVQLGLAALLPAAAAAAVALPLSDATSESPEMSLEARDIVKRGLCTPTGPGYCNLGLQFFDHYIPPQARRGLVKYANEIIADAYIYDRSCNVVGSYTDVGPGTNIYSQLPWVMVCIAIGGSVPSPTWDFHYSNQDIDYVRDCSCSDCPEGNTRATCCQCAFRC